ncbi:hypothetical protein SCHPADRAFT_686706 [Schizopora paradoxa]|uniref:Uncharacterized protein n=1 Tax=Schizopora paradoxa TaxID=27342 RepID=A0A0H2R406_9AGAM|nr:hypothetical protein SCHPADRAFT_686706 [Schizopora paradoxa]
MKGGNKSSNRMLAANVKPGAGAGTGMAGFGGLGELDYARMSMPHTHQGLHNLQIPGSSLASTASPTSAYNQTALPVSLERSGGGNPHKRPRIDSTTGPGPGPYTTYGIDDPSGGAQSPSSYRLPHAGGGGGSAGGMFPPPNPGPGPHTPASPTNPAFFAPSSGFGRGTGQRGTSAGSAGSAGGGGYGMYPPPQHQGGGGANPFAALLGAGAPSSGSGSVSPHPHGTAATGYGGAHGHGTHVEPLDWPVHASPSSGGPGGGGGGGPPSASSPHPHGFPTPSSARPSGAGGGGGADSSGGGGGGSNSWLDFLSNSSASAPAGGGGGSAGGGGGPGSAGGGLLDELSRPASGARRAEDSWERGLSGGSPGLGKRGRSDSNVLKEEDGKGRPNSTQPDAKGS